MKNIYRTIPLMALLLICTIRVHAQSNFSPDAYMQFREVHEDYTAGELVGDHPAKTTYYTSRQYPADLSSVPWYDSINKHFNFTEDEKELLKQLEFEQVNCNSP